MSRGKYSPYVCDRNQKPWEGVELKTGSEGTVEVDADGFDFYGYDENGVDVSGNTEWEYLFDEDLFENHCRLAESRESK